MTRASEPEIVVASQIIWVETVAGSKIKVASAEFVEVSYGQGAVTERALRIRPKEGGVCFVPVRAIARIDINEGSA